LRDIKGKVDKAKSLGDQITHYAFESVEVEYSGLLQIINQSEESFAVKKHFRCISLRQKIDYIFDFLANLSLILRGKLFCIGIK